MKSRIRLNRISLKSALAAIILATFASFLFLPSTPTYAEKTPAETNKTDRPLKHRILSKSYFAILSKCAATSSDAGGFRGTIDPAPPANGYAGLFKDEHSINAPTNNMMDYTDRKIDKCVDILYNTNNSYDQMGIFSYMGIKGSINSEISEEARKLLQYKVGDSHTVEDEGVAKSRCYTGFQAYGSLPSADGAHVQTYDKTKICLEASRVSQNEEEYDIYMTFPGIAEKDKPTKGYLAEAKVRGALSSGLSAIQFGDKKNLVCRVSKSSLGDVLKEDWFSLYNLNNGRDCSLSMNDQGAIPQSVSVTSIDSATSESMNLGSVKVNTWKMEIKGKVYSKFNESLFGANSTATLKAGENELHWLYYQYLTKEQMCGGEFRGPNDGTVEGKIMIDKVKKKGKEEEEVPLSFKGMDGLDKTDMKYFYPADNESKIMMKVDGSYDKLVEVKCSDILTEFASHTEYGTSAAKKNGGQGGADEPIFSAGQSSDGSNTTDDGNQDGETPGTEEEPSCYDHAKALGWVICAALDTAGTAAKDLYNQVARQFLSINASYFEDNSPVLGAWNLFRDIANIVFIILLLLVIFSQITGYGIDNYGIKKILPKLIITAILINLSYIICRFAVDVSNILGNGLKGLFEGLAAEISVDSSYKLQNTDTVDGIFTGLLTGLGVVGAAGGGLALWSMGPAFILPVLIAVLVVLISVLFIFILLGVRQAAVILLVAISPVAVVCYLLPNTKKVFDRYIKMMSGLLLLYPICGLLVGAGAFASRLLLTTAGGTLMAIIAVTVMVAPFLFIPTLLRNSFSALGNIGAKISGMGSRIGSGTSKNLKGSEPYKSAQTKLRSVDPGGLRGRFARSGLGRITGFRGSHARALASRDKLGREDAAALTLLDSARNPNEQLAGMMSRLSSAIDKGDEKTMNSIITRATRKYGAGAASQIGAMVATKSETMSNDKKFQRAVQGMGQLMQEDSTFNNLMISKAGDVAEYLSNGGRDARGNATNVAHYSANSAIVSGAKDFATQSAATLQRMANAGGISSEIADQLLTDDDAAIRSGMQSEANKVRAVLGAASPGTIYTPPAQRTQQQRQTQEGILRAQQDIARDTRNLLNIYQQQGNQGNQGGQSNQGSQSSQSNQGSQGGQGAQGGQGSQGGQGNP